MCVKVQEAIWKWKSKKQGSEIVASQAGAGQLCLLLVFLLSVWKIFVLCHYFCLQGSREAHLTPRSIMCHGFHKRMTEDFFLLPQRGFLKMTWYKLLHPKAFPGAFLGGWTWAGSRGLWSDPKPGPIHMGTVLSSKLQTKTPLYGA